MAGAQNWLIVTGAGASRNLGVERAMPLMGDWARALVDALNEIAAGFGLAVGLRADMVGEEFEEALGRFLAWSRSLPTTRTLLPLGFDNVVGEDDTQVRRWFDQGEARAERALLLVHRVLYELFGQNNVSSVSARDAYGALLEQLGVGDQSLLAYGTTNYDVAGEMGLDELGFKPHWGETPSLVHNPVVDPDHVYDRIGRGVVPVLHLHGRVGWYSTTRASSSHRTHVRLSPSTWERQPCSCPIRRRTTPSSPPSSPFGDSSRLRSARPTAYSSSAIP
jgi:hypothetical protein